MEVEGNIEQKSNTCKEKDFTGVYEDLRKQGACKICAYRFLCSSELQLRLDEFLENNGYEQDSTSVPKMAKENSCIICLGLFENKVLEDVEKQILKETNKTNYDCDTYMLALVLPASCKLREQSAFVYLKSKFPALYKECPYAPRLGLKESWRFYCCSAISKTIGKSLEVNSSLLIQITFSYAGDCKDFRNISKIVKGKMNLAAALKILDDSDFARLYPFPMEIPDDCVHVASVDMKRDSIFFAGRYNKFSRELSQTPWILSDGERKMELSVEEIISERLKTIMKAEDSRFSSSGREDVDVRTLGTGRPFAVELINPRISNVSFNDIRNVENEINEAGKSLISVRHLQIVDRSQMLILKQGEEHKTKDYCCVCIMKKVCDIDDLKKMLPSTPLAVFQKTPIRVLHRRTLSTRPKTIHELTLEGVNVPSPEGSTVFKINLKTEAGTYIKEFVHGDFGRTQPNLSAILGDIPIDVLALDVTNVEVDWPPEINYPEKSPQ